MTGSSRTRLLAVAATAAAVTFAASSGRGLADEPVLKLQAIVRGAPTETLSIELLRWSTDGERMPLLTALSAPPPSPPPPAADAAGRRGGRAGRGGRGGRGGGPPATPASRLTAAIKAAPTIGFIWADGPTGYSVKYAWRGSLPDGRERIVLATDRRLGAHAPGWPAASPSAADQEFTVIEVRLSGEGAPRPALTAAASGEGKTSLHSTVVVDAGASTLALADYDAAPLLFMVTR